MQRKIVVVVKDGMVQSVYVDHPHDYDVEVIDLDIQDEAEFNAAQERLDTIEKCLVNVY